MHRNYVPPNLPGTCAIRRPMKPNETHKVWLIRIRVAMLAHAIDSVSFQEHARNLRRNRPRGPSRGIWWFRLSSVMSC